MSALRRDGSGLLVRRVRGKTIPQSCWPRRLHGEVAFAPYRRKWWRDVARNGGWDTSPIGMWILMRRRHKSLR